MIKFDPPSIKDEMNLVKLTIEKHNCELGDWYPADDPDFDPSEFDDIKITYSTGVGLWVPKADDSPELTIRELIDLSKELDTATLENNTRYISQNRILQLIEPIEDTKLSILNLGGDWPTERLFEHKLNFDINEITIGIVNGFSPFSLIISKNGDYEDFWPPFHEEDYFIEIIFSKPIEYSFVDSLIETYLFELNSSLNLIFRQHVRPTTDGYEDFDYAQEKAMKLVETFRLRSLISGKGIKDACHLFNRAMSIEDDELRLFSLVKVIEYIAPTVVRKKANEQIRQRLLSADALNPDAEFIADLIKLIENNRESRKDAAALKLTIFEACDPIPLAKKAPKYLSKIHLADDHIKVAGRKAALEELSNCITATRNRIAHAKSNFKPTGKECPKEQLTSFVECVKLVTIQVIRWFATCPEELRVLNTGQ
jgi:hypothetical protein